MTIHAVLDLLSCPHCSGPLALTDDRRGVGCTRGHRFDLARQGYLNLLAGRQPANADTAAMIGARERFLAAGPFDSIADAVVRLTAAGGPERLLDAGAGTGRLLATLLDAAPGSRGIALDVSTAAARRAARAHPRLGAIVADVWRRLPIADGAIDLVLSNFAPRNPPEFTRVLRPDGSLLTITPTAEHLTELRRTYGLMEIQADKTEHLIDTLTPSFDLAAHERVQARTRWPAELVADAIAMGPNAFHTAADRPVTGAAVTVSVDVRRWIRRLG